ncbi:GMC family oxidoreductase [Sphingomonas sp. LY54]|uniref:GMC family oxidoreductase n=1 Tax=Sphingomonas sp. LY54 TaxID=3095343 RepID=UPI002D77A094|nr:GMC family oxidoreductase [Sphingomonas sp. LY54]WRP27754.1 GMC family oxidoreductase [Sphingomonas sp. LY54]
MATEYARERSRAVGGGDVVMLIDLQADPDATLEPSDVCIVGAGAAGVTLARRLSQRGIQVCLLESGGFDFEQATQDLYRGANVGMPYYDLDQSRLRFFGGTVAIWGGRCAQLDPIDFEQRAWVPYSGWPITHGDLDPYYRQAHDMLELGEFHYRDDVWDALGTAGPGLDPRRIDTVLWRFDEAVERFTAARSRDLTDAANVRIVLHANAVKLQASPDARRIEHVEVRPLGGPSRQIRARRFVIACGAIENSRLLIASNDVQTAGIGNDRDLVGRFFMEHPSGRLGRIETHHAFELWAAFQKRFMREGPPLAPALRLGDATQRERATLNSIATLKLQRDPSRGVALGNRLYQSLKHSIAPTRKGRALDHAYRAIRAWIHREVRHSIEHFRARTGMTGLYLMIRAEQAPNPESRVLLSNERDALGNRRADLQWQLSAIDKHTAKVMAETFDLELRRLNKGSVVPSAWLDEPGPQWPVDPTIGNHPIGNYHQVGGTRMSAEPAAGVVDAHSRVHGYGNLYVAGSSVFATSGWANPTLTIFALALRLADHLAAEGRPAS